MNAQYSLVAINTPYGVPLDPGPPPVVAIWLTEVESVKMVGAHREDL